MTLAKLMICALLAITFTACGGDDSSNNANNTTNNTTNNTNPDPNAAKIAAGKVIFEGKGGCTSCHGLDGSMSDPPGPEAGEQISGAEVQKESDATLMDVVKNGKGNMPAYKSSLDDTEIANVIAYVRTLAK
jgi:mono/diheme cytochrome c family protein